MKKVLAVIFAVVLILQAGVLTAFAEAPEESRQIITISDIVFSASEDADTSTAIGISGLPDDSVDIVSEEWSCPEEIVISGENIEIKDGKYSYKLVLRANGTLTFDNDLEIYYQGISGKYQLNYEIDETDNHIMIVTGTFENIIIESPLLEKMSDKNKEWILSHISEDTYFYQLVLRTAEGFTFTNTLRFLFDSNPLGYSLDYAYDLLTDQQSLIINWIGDIKEVLPEVTTTDGEEDAGSAGSAAVSDPEAETAVADSEVVEPVSKKAANEFDIKDSKRFVKAGKTIMGATVLNSGTGIKTYRIKGVNKGRYAGFFKINKLTGSIKVNPKTPKGTYAVTVQAKAAKTKSHKASDWKTAKVTIIVK